MQHRLLQLNGSRKHGKPNGSRKLNGSRKHGNKGTIHGDFLDDYTGPIDDKSLMQIGAIVLETLAFFYVFSCLLLLPFIGPAQPTGKRKGHRYYLGWQLTSLYSL